MGKALDIGQDSPERLLKKYRAVTVKFTDVLRDRKRRRSSEYYECRDELYDAFTKVRYSGSHGAYLVARGDPEF